MKTLTYSEVRQNLTAAMNETVDDRIPILITRQKGTACVLLSLDEYQSLEETAYLMRSPNNARRLMDSIDELNAGKGLKKEINE
ncbi:MULTISPECIES: YoeB-YefM toxin-antitoxin system antitoxin YefM [Morganella]|uniref:Antitoxin n=2 Tax=Bacteria TaxID=2 RepID=A0A9Q4CSG9_MORMO|nr:MULTISPECIES: YoeB-YefM toxin-antitoxin system antitoxin YefM [Morganella]BEP22793.1 YoeB-YefM toxin-antitoxin system antitoxin YefM [Morganella morganii subsp. sibonii]EGT3622911.1 YoeB-YefM toxin-antitoxin system antitoxin YefM [Morganella morganii]EGT3631016.1 YoeB-YefM toxin-antitoxin system antitoxin YefM [Morganella morganii]EGT3635496.1 YoeB-YefM toxin-antitoxin system antitoxin YefM [Morganella morganii]EJD6040264.1 YoeB-YefM toxin-antitoxin system antitoxin YefM [Morganella morgani